MTQVSNQAELQAALNANATNIEIINDFTISAQININYNVIISSSGGNVYTIKKSSTYFSVMFRIVNNGFLTLQNIILDGDKDNHPAENTANRTLISVTGGHLSMQEGAVLQNNNAYIEGGGAYLAGNQAYQNTLEMSGNATIRNCYSRTNGGGLMIAWRNDGDAINIGENVIIENNQAANGAGIYARVYDTEVNNILAIKGNTKIQNNIAISNGGGVFVSNITGSSKNINLQLTDTVQISNNKSSHNGGGVYFYGTNQNDTLSINKQVVVESNTASGNGGGIYSNNAINNFEGIVISNNQGGTGGGIYIINSLSGKFDMRDSQITSNKATNGASGSGGGIWFNNQATTIPYSISLSNSIFTNNESSAMGGGIYIVDSGNGSNATLNNCEIKGNKAQTNGGGVLITIGANGIINFDSTNIEENTSANNGGGTYLTTGSTTNVNFNFDNCNIINNYAEVQGGGLRLSSYNGKITTKITTSTISGNTSNANSGGGIWSGGTKTDLLITGNTVINGNETNVGNGGGIYFNSIEGILMLKDNTQILNNLANRINSNFGNQGGGIFIAPGTCTISGNTEINNNAALKYGGGISLRENAILTLESGIIDGNTADLGGGVHNRNSTFYFQDGQINNNKANIGGGIYNH